MSDETLKKADVRRTHSDNWFLPHSRFWVRSIILAVWLVILAPVMGLLIGMLVSGVVHWYDIGRGIW